MIDCVGVDIAYSQQDRRRIIWLCPECSRHFTVESWRPPGQQLRMRKSSSLKHLQRAASALNAFHTETPGAHAK